MPQAERTSGKFCSSRANVKGYLSTLGSYSWGVTLVVQRGMIKSRKPNEQFVLSVPVDTHYIYLAAPLGVKRPSES